MPLTTAHYTGEVQPTTSVQRLQILYNAMTSTEAGWTHMGNAIDFTTLTEPAAGANLPPVIFRINDEKSGNAPLYVSFTVGTNTNTRPRLGIKIGKSLVNGQIADLFNYQNSDNIWATIQYSGSYGFEFWASKRGFSLYSEYGRTDFERVMNREGQLTDDFAIFSKGNISYGNSWSNQSANDAPYVLMGDYSAGALSTPARAHHLRGDGIARDAHSNVKILLGHSVHVGGNIYGQSHLHTLVEQGYASAGAEVTIDVFGQPCIFRAGKNRDNSYNDMTGYQSVFYMRPA